MSDARVYFVENIKDPRNPTVAEIEAGVYLGTLAPAPVKQIRSVYVAGRMRGLPGFGFEAFHAAVKFLRSMGLIVVSPAEHDEEAGFDFSRCDGTEDLAALGFDLKEALMWDLGAVSRCDAIFLLKGWEDSKGAQAELALAEALGKEVIFGYEVD